MSRNLVNVYGPSGSGKTSLIKELLKVDRLGSLFHKLIGIDIAVEITPKYSLAEMPMPTFKGSVSEYFMLFGIILKENRPPEENILKLLATIRDFSAQIKQHKYEKLLSTSVDKLSAGEKRRLCIARALLEKPSLTIIDEPYANSDESVYGTINGAILTAKNSLLITHRPVRMDTSLLSKHRSIDIRQLALVLNTEKW